jgi:Sec-independent protein translocase protein TatA
MSIGLPELLIIAAIVLLLLGPGLFALLILLLGPGRSARLAGDLGRIFHAFLDGISGKDEKQGRP